MHVVPNAQGTVQEGAQKWVKPAGSFHVRFLWAPGRTCESHSSLHMVHEVMFSSLQTHMKG